MRKDFHQDNGHSSDLDQKKSYSTNEDSQQGEWDRIAEQMMLTFADSKHAVFRSTSPLSRGVLKSKGGGKLSIHCCIDPGTIETVFRTIISVNKLSMYGAVSEKCEECDTCHDRTGRPVVEGQSNPLFVPSVMKTHVPLTDDSAQHEEDLLQRYQERIEKLSQQERVINFCTGAGFLTTVEVGQYFMTNVTEDSHNSQIQWPVASTHCQEMKIYLNQKVGFGRTPKLGPYWKSQPVAYKVNVEWKSELSL